MKYTELNFEVFKQDVPGTDGNTFTIDIFNGSECIAAIYQNEYANLMAAAPGMLAALKDVVDWLSDEKFYKGGLTEMQAKTLFEGIIKEIKPSIDKVE